MKRHILRHWFQERGAVASEPPAIFKALQYVRLTILHWFSPTTLRRIPEPFALTEQSQHVEDYSKAFETVMVVPYVLILDLVRRLTRGNTNPQKRAVDLCCGPGHFTRMLARHLHVSEVIGVDLSEPMLEKAQENATKENLNGQTKYIKSDVSDLQSLATHSMDIVSFMDGAHHMSSVQAVSSILKEADRVAKPEGLIIVLDPVRPKTLKTANLYHRIAGEAYEKKGLTYFNKDFHDSLLASWSFEELYSAIPQETNRQWVQLIPFGFPAFQVIVGLPAGQDKVFASKGLAKDLISQLIPSEGKADWEMLKTSFRLAEQRKFFPKQSEE